MVHVSCVLLWSIENADRDVALLVDYLPGLRMIVLECLSLLSEGVAH